MAYSYDQVFAADPANPANIAQNAAITIYAPGDPTMTPLAITDPSGGALTNPITVNANGFGSAFQHATLDRVAWSGGGFTGFFTSYEGMKDEAVAARSAAETAAAEAGAQAVVRLDELIAAGSFEGPAGPLTNLTVGTVEATPGNPLTDDIIASEVLNGTATTAALNATILNQTSGKLNSTDVSNSALLAAGKTVALCGDSITDGAGSTNVSVDSYRAYLGKILGTAKVKIAEHGVPGESAAGLLARVPAIIAENPAAAVIQIGTNASTNLATYKADFTAILDLFLAARIPVVVNLLPPRGSAASAEAERTRTYNLWLRHIAALRGLPLVDVFAALVDPVTGLMAAAYDADGTHPTPAGHLQIAKAVAPVLQTIINDPLPWVVAPGAPGLVSNPLMAGGTVSTPPTSWTSTGVTGGGTGTVGTVAKDGALKAGDWMKITADATAVGATVTVGRYASITPAPAAGDVILIAATVKQDAGSETAATVQFSDGSTVIAIPMQSAGVADPGKVLATYTIPGTAYVNPRVRCITSAAAGTAKAAYFGEVQVWNLTALGLTELAT